MGMAIWLSLLGVGVKWVTNPVLRPPAANLSSITAEQSARAFPIHFVALHNVGNVSPTGKPPAMTGGQSHHQFDYEEWAFRELRKRGVVFFVLWTVGGFGIHWSVSKFFRKRSGAL